MYLEINNRQTGKTTRLIKAVVNHLICGGEALVLTFNMQWAKELEKKIKLHLNQVHDIPHSQLSGYYHRLNVCSCHGSDQFLGRSDKARRFWDEFSFIPYVEWRAQDYYCTSYSNENNRRIDDPIVIDIPDANDPARNMKQQDAKPTARIWNAVLTKEAASYFQKNREGCEMVITAETMKDDGKRYVFTNGDEIISVINKDYVIWIGRQK